MLNWVEFFYVSDGREIEVFRANFGTFRYEAHFHDFYAFGMVERGGSKFVHPTGVHWLDPGNISVVNPGELHDGAATTPGGWTFVSIYIAPSALTALISECLDMDANGIVFTSPKIVDRMASAAFVRLIRAAKAPRCDVAFDTALLDFFHHLVVHYVDRAPAPHGEAGENRAVARAADYIEEHLEEQITLARLAAAAGLSRFHFVRVFHHAYGITPHVYLRHRRLVRARDMLRRRTPVAAIAASTGFADQSHLTRSFKSVYGITPAAYQRGAG